MNFSAMKVATRLGLGFALVIVLGLTVAILGRLELQTIGRELQQLSEQEMVKVELASQLKDNVNEIARSVRNVKTVARIAATSPVAPAAERSSVSIRSHTPLQPELFSSQVTPTPVRWSTCRTFSRAFALLTEKFFSPRSENMQGNDVAVSVPQDVTESK